MNGNVEGHLTAEQLRKYIRDEMSFQEREQAELELYVCESCLARFMEELGSSFDLANQDEPPVPLPDFQPMEERIVAQLTPSASPLLYRPDQPVPSSGIPRRVPWLRRPAAQYAVAACITVLLLVSGALTGLSERLGQLEAAQATHQLDEEVWPSDAPSWSQRMISRTSGWLEGIQSSRFK